MVQAGIDVADALLTVTEVARKMNVCQRTVHNLMAKGHLAFVNIAVQTKKYRRVPRAELERFLRERFTGTA